MPGYALIIRDGFVGVEHRDDLWSSPETAIRFWPVRKAEAGDDEFVRLVYSVSPRTYGGGFTGRINGREIGIDTLKHDADLTFEPVQKPKAKRGHHPQWIDGQWQQVRRAALTIRDTEG